MSTRQSGRNANVNHDQMTVMCINNACDVRELGEQMMGNQPYKDTWALTGVNTNIK